MKKMVWIMVIAIAVAFTACKEPELEPEPEHEPEHVHKWEWITIRPATCAAIGLEVGVCKLDASHTTIRVIALLTHTIAGTYRCSVCNNPYELGDTGPGGGKIFYRIETGFTMTDDNTTAYYLEAAPTDRATALTWASEDYYSTDIADTEEAIGTGRKNTALILVMDVDAPAAKACNEYRNGSKTDWFLPSKDELNQLYENRTSVGNMGTSMYWSSSQSSNHHACFQRFSDGNKYNYHKFNIFSVRPVRAF